MLTEPTNSENEIRGIKSVERMLFIMQQFLNTDEISLKELAEITQSSNASISPYLKSLIQLGLVTKSTHGYYKLGESCLDLGMSALEKHDPFLEIENAINCIFDETKNGVIVSVWGTMGPTAIRIKDNIKGLYPEVRVGALISMINSSIGRVFTANLPYNVIKNALYDEEERYQGTKLNQFQIDDLMNEIQFWDKSLQVFHQTEANMTSLSVPIFEVGGHIKYVLTIFHKTHVIMVQQEFLIEKLKKVSEELSKKIIF